MSAVGCIEYFAEPPEFADFATGVDAQTGTTDASDGGDDSGAVMVSCRDACLSVSRSDCYDVDSCPGGYDDASALNDVCRMACESGALDAEALYDDPSCQSAVEMVLAASVEARSLCERAFHYVIVVDESREENMAGTAGADFCGLLAVCGGASSAGVLAEVRRGIGTVCDGTHMNAPCEAGVDRANPDAVLDDGTRCEPTSNPSDYASVGVGGQLSVQFGVDIVGCQIRIEELAGCAYRPT